MNRLKLVSCLGVSGIGLAAIAFKPEVVSEAKENLRSILFHKTQYADIDKCRQLSQGYAERCRFQKSIPGLVIGVSVRGKNVWTEGFGFANVETGSHVHEDTVMRIASISKSITSLLVAKLLEEGKLDLDKSVAQYLKEDQFPTKHWEGKKVDITLRQLMSHLGGIRHYYKAAKADPKEKKGKTEKELVQIAASTKDCDHAEYYSRKKFADVFDSLTMFKADDLVHKPGAFLYTTYGYTLISAIVQTALPEGQSFGTHLVDTICRRQLGMNSTFIDENEPIIYNRANYYVMSKAGKLLNVPAVENR